MMQPMAPNGKWVQPSADVPPVYVTRPEHVTRLVLDGGHIIGDPREGQELSLSIDPSITEMQREIAALRAALAQKSEAIPEVHENEPSSRRQRAPRAEN